MAELLSDDEFLNAKQPAASRELNDAEFFAAKPEPGVVSQVVSAVGNSLGAGSGNTVRGLGEFVQAPGPALTSFVANAAAAVKNSGGNTATSTTPVDMMGNPTGEAPSDLTEGEVTSADAGRREARSVARIAADEAELARQKARRDGTVLGNVGGFMEDAGKSAQDFYGKRLREGAPMAVRQQQAIHDADGFVGTVKAMAANPLGTAATTAQSLPDMAIGMGAGSIAAKGASIMARASAEKAAQAVFQETLLKAAANPATFGSATKLAREAAGKAYSDAIGGASASLAGGIGLVVEGAQSGMSTSAQVKDLLDQRNPDGSYRFSDQDLATHNPRYAELLAQGTKPDQARRLLGAELGDEASPLAALWTVGAGKLSGAAGAEGRAITSQVTTKKAALQSVGKETLEEGMQSPGEDYAAWDSTRQIDANQKPFDLGGSIAQGVVGGLVQAGPMHGGGFASSRMQEAKAPEVRLAGRPVTAYTDEQLAGYAGSGVLTESVRTKVEAEISRRKEAAAPAAVAQDPGQGEQLDSEVQRFAANAGIGPEGQPGVSQPAGDAGAGNGNGGADANGAAGLVRPDAGAPADGVQSSPTAGLGASQLPGSLTGDTIPAGYSQQTVQQQLEQRQAGERQETISEVVAQQQERKAESVASQTAAPVANMQAGSQALRNAGVKPEFHAGPDRTEPTREVSDLGTAGARNTVDIAVGNQHLAKQEELARKAGLSIEIPRLAQIRDQRVFKASQQVADAIHAITGVRPVMYHDARTGAADGFALGGKSYVNAANLEQSLHFTTFHETFHVAEQRAAGGDVHAQQFVKMAYSIFDMISPAGKEKYAREYLLRNEMKSGMTVEQALASPKLRSEMVADFFGRRGEDAAFMRRLAQRDPKGFGGFVRTWIDSITNLIEQLKAKRAHGVKDVDQFIRKLSHAKAVAASALIEWRKANPELAKSLPASGQTGMQMSSSLDMDPAKILPPGLLAQARDIGSQVVKAPDNLTPEGRARAVALLTPRMRDAEAAKPEFDRRVRNVADQLGGAVKLAKVKGAERAATKLVLDFNWDADKMRDLLRGSIIVPTINDIPAALRALSANFDVEPGRLKDRFAKPMATGYRDVLANIIMPNGVKGEVQIHIPEIMAVKHIGHSVYEVERDLPPGSEQQRSLEALQSQIYGTAMQAHQARLDSMAYSAKNSDSEQGSPLALTSDELMSRFEGSNAEQVPSGKQATGTDSKSKNLVPAGKVGNESMKASVKPKDTAPTRKPGKVDASKTDALSMVAERGKRVVGTRVTLAPAEKTAITTSADKTGVSEREISGVVKTHKMAHPLAQGWAPLEFKGAKFDDKGKIEYAYKPVPYGFSNGADGDQLKPGTPEYKKRVTAVARGMADEVRRIYRRSVDGDKNAQNILAQAGWYKAMRARLRQEFGGLGDVFADLLGATSPNTPVRDNWTNAVDSLRRASRGDYDALMPKWVEWADRTNELETGLRGWFNDRMAEGLSKKAIKALPEYTRQLDALKAAKALGDELLPTKESGKKYGFNGRNVVRAMTDLWRVVNDADADIARGGTAPKALNFSGNLIGFRERATIDVWAARMLQRLAGGLRIPSMAETGVSGAMRSDASTTLQFGFGQDVFAEAAKRIRGDAELKTNSTLASINDDDLQAVVWFVEKELWTVNGWTSAAGEGGSFELEASLTGSKQQDKIKLLRKIVDSKLSSPAKKASSRAELATLERSVDRFVGGLSTQMSADTQGVEFVPTDADMARLANVIRTAVYEADDGATVMASKAVSTEGRYGGVERSLDLEVVSREGYDPAPLWRKMLLEAQAARQDSTFLSRVLREGEDYDAAVHRPGIEIYFREAASREKLEDMLAKLAKEGVEFLTVITDGRRSPSAMAGAMPAAVGVRMQYVPEFEQRYGMDDLSGLSEAQLRDKVEQKAQDMQDLAARIVATVEGVSYAGQFWHETHVAFSHEYQEKINGKATGVPSEESGQARAAAWSGQSIRQGIESADRQSEQASGTESDSDADLGGDAPGPSYSNSAKQRDAGSDGADRKLNTDSPAFKKWFGDSNLRTEDGKPMVLYHGTDRPDFKTFKASTYGAMGPGVYLGDSPEASEGYAGDGKGARMMMVYARGKYIGNTAWSKLVGEHGWAGARKVAEADGIAGIWDQKFEDAVNVWDPANIKSVFNTEFDEKNPSISMSSKQTLADDMEGQAKYLEQRAKEAGHKDVDAWVDADYAGFVKAAGEWREQNPAEMLLSKKVEDFADIAFRHGKNERDVGVEISKGAPHPAMTMVGAGRDQPVMLHANYAWHIHNNHPDITARDLADLPELLKKPRAVYSAGPGRVSVIVDRRDAEGRPMMVGMEKVLSKGRNQQRITDVHTMFGLDDSMKELLTVAQMKTGAAWLPSEEVLNVEAFLARFNSRQAGDQPASSPLVGMYQSGAAANHRGLVPRSTKASVLSDAALAKFSSASNLGWEKLKVELDVPRGAKLEDIAFARKFTADVPEETKTEASRRVVQDQHIRMRTLREWAAANNVPMTSASDVYLAEERMHGRTASRTEDFREKTVKPLVELVQRSGFTVDQVAEYLHAQHAEERNKQVAKINKTLPDGGSGMTTADANTILAAAPAGLAAVANRFQQITDQTKTILLNAGIISQDTANAFSGAYKKYVPLKGGDEDAAGKTGSGQGLSVNGKQKRAMGHTQRDTDEHIVENILRDHERAIMLAEKNRVGQAMMLWLTEMNDDRIGTVDKPAKRAVLMPKYEYEVRVGANTVNTFDTDAQAKAFVVQQTVAKTPGASRMRVVKSIADQNVQYMASPQLADNEAQVYVAGHAVRIQLNDPLLAQSYKRLGIDEMGRLMQVSRSINTYLSKAYTGYNPAFIPRNMIRDFGSGLIKITGNFGADISTKTLMNYPKAMATLLRYSMTGRSTPDIDAYRAHGGSTGAAYLGDLERIGTNIQNDFEEYEGVMAQVRKGKKLAAARVASAKVIGGLVGWIEHLNMAAENSMRLAVFKAVRDKTGSVEEAASAAKNCTVNFNRKGEMGQTFGGLYLFFNPNVQDTASIVETFTRGKHSKQAAVLTAGMVGIAYAMAALQFGGSDDDYEHWKKLGDSTRDKNLVLRTGEKTHVTIPVPFGFGFFHTLGNTLFMLQRGESLNKLSIGVASNFLSHFSPLGNPLEGAHGWNKVDPKNFLQMLPVPGTGELGRDVIRVGVNKNSFGSEIVPDSKFDEDRPDFLRMFRPSKGSIYDSIARGLGKLTGGTESLPGWIDVSPESLKFWNHTLTGGTGTFVYDIAHLSGLALRAAANPSDPNVGDLAPEKSEIPILRDYRKEEGVKNARSAFWEASKEADSALKDFQRAKKAGDSESMKKIVHEDLEAIALAKASAGFGKMVKAQRDQVDKINGDTTTSLAYKRAAIRVLEQQESELYDRFLREVTLKGHQKEARLAAER